MTLTGLRLIWERNRKAERPGVGRDPEAEYFQTVEEFFVSRRGDPLFLSNADWLLIRKWRRAGMPLRVVLRGIADALDGHAHSFSRDRKVGSLPYCAAEVDAAAERWRRALAGADAGVDVGSRLAELADRLEHASLKASAEKVARKIAAELRELEQATLSEQSAALAAAETKLLRALEKDAGGGRGGARRGRGRGRARPLSGPPAREGAGPDP